MLNLYGDLQQKILVTGLTNARAFVPFPDLYAGQNLPVTLWALQPSGTPGAPYNVRALTAALVSLTTQNGGVSTTVVSTASWIVSGGQLTGFLTIPSGVTFPAGAQYLPARLALDLTTADGTTHVETACTLRNPAFPVTAAPPGVSVEPALGNPGADNSILSSLANGVRSWLATTTWGRALLGYANATAFYAANPPSAALVASSLASQAINPSTIGSTTPVTGLVLSNSFVSWPSVANATQGLDWFKLGSWGSRLRVDLTSGDLVFFSTTTGSEVERFRVGNGGGIAVQGSLTSQNLTLGLGTGAGVSTVTARYYPGVGAADALTFKTFSGDGADEYSRLTITTAAGSSHPGTATVRVDNANLQVNGYASSSVGFYTGGIVSTSVLAVDGASSFDDGAITTNGFGTITAPTFVAIYNFSSDGGGIYSDGDGTLSVYRVNALYGFYSDANAIYSDGSGVLTVAGLNVGGLLFSSHVYASDTLGVWGASGPSSQPAAIADATDLASALAAINSLLAAARSYGLIHS